MKSNRQIVLIRGGGDLATGVAYKLHKAGYPLFILELPQPLVVRRPVALASAVWDGEVMIEGLRGRRVGALDEAMELASTGVIPVLVSAHLPETVNPSGQWRPQWLVDARMAKRNIDTHLGQARFVVALGPGFTAGIDCHAVIETNRGHRLGRVIWQGSAQADTGTPGIVAGKGTERVLRAPIQGVVRWDKNIGQRAYSGEKLGAVTSREATHPILAPFEGVIRGLIVPGIVAKAGQKIGDIDPRADESACFTISDKALAIGAGVLEAILSRERNKVYRTAPLRQFPPIFRSEHPLSLASAFSLEQASQLVAIVGGGGKSTLMFNLARELPGTVIMSTTTRIFANQMKLAPSVHFLQVSHETRKHAGHEVPAGLLEDLARFGRCLLVSAPIVGEKASGIPPEMASRLLSREAADFILVEADGSRMKPCKAPADHEPVIPGGATLVVPVVGIDALDGPIDQRAHRPELVASLTGLDTRDSLTGEALAKLLIHAQGGLRNVPESATVIPMVNKVESEAQLAQAREMAKIVLSHPRVSRVVIGALRSARPILEVHRKVTAVILAAGRSERMGRTKQLLPWGKTTVLGRTIENMIASSVHDVVVVIGHEAEAVTSIAEQHGLDTVFNPDYADGEMLSSLQAAIRELPVVAEAVLVVLADQPTVESETVDRLLVAFWRGKGELILPTYKGKRGNPVLIGRPYFQELLALPKGAAPRDLLKRYEDAVFRVEVDSPTVRHDVDDMADYERLRPK